MKDTKCILPFIHLYIQPDGELKPCCISSKFDESVNVKKMSIDEAFNSTQMKELRKDMIEGKRNKVCDVCYKKEDETGNSQRKVFNNNKRFEEPNLYDDYSVEPQFQYIDIRFSNLCNFKCRMCTHEFSSHWYEDHFKFEKNYPKDTPKVIKISDTIVEDLIPFLKNIKNVYFAGGEPLIMPEHYNLLKFLYDNLPVHEDTNTRDLLIHYNTNLSVIKYDEESLVDLWKGFNKVFLSISCDGIEKVGEYQRVGFKHDKFIENLKTIQKYFTPKSTNSGGNGLFYNFQYTTTVWNLYHIFDFISYMKENKYIKDESQIDFHHTWVPHHTSVNNLTDSEKTRAINFLQKGIKTLESEKTLKEIQTIIKFIRNDVNLSWPPVIVGVTQELDNINNTNANDLNGVNFRAMNIEFQSPLPKRKSTLI